MFKKLLILSLCVSVLIVISAPFSSVNAGGKKNKINWRIAGMIVQYIKIFNPQTGDDEGLHSLINLLAQGSPGPAKITLLSRTSTTAPPTPFPCLEGYGDPDTGPIYFDKNEFVALFPDQSLLFASVDPDQGGRLCFGSTGTYFIVKMIITGGTGRFEGASGSFTGTGYGYPNQTADGTLVGEHGNLTGKIYLPD
jgi:hypothetical protein